jgi:putative endonuclease
MNRQCFVYIMTNHWHSVLYTGVASKLDVRVFHHKTGATPGFTSRYHVDLLVHHEEKAEVLSAIEREKQIKSWNRRRKMDLIATMNPNWRHLSEDWE